MKKPQPPFGRPEDISKDFNEPSSMNIPPIATPRSIADQLEDQQGDFLIDDNVIERSEPGASPFDAEAKRLCESCVFYWGLKNLAPVKNLKPDGTPFTQREDFCIFKDKLFSLSDRMVHTCTRYEKKVTK